MIYFIQSGDNGPIKIGKSNDPSKRLLSLQTNSPKSLILLGLMDGDIKEEKDIHTKFSDFRIKGEWFRPSNDLIEFIESNTQKQATEEECMYMYGQLLYGIQGVIEEENDTSMLKMLKDDLVNFIDSIDLRIKNIKKKASRKKKRETLLKQEL